MKEGFMKGILEFNLPEEQEEFDLANKASALRNTLTDAENFVFRPARKHGYSDQEIQKLVEELDNLSDGKATELISLLEAKFYECAEANDVLGLL